MKSNAETQVAVGMSGGVDSSVAALILLRVGYRVTGISMQTWDGGAGFDNSGKSGCYGPGEEHDLATARRISASLGIEHVTVPLGPEYRQEVLEYFRSEYLAGRTPNPCVRCNMRVKFGLLLERAMASGVRFDYFATGHYARVIRKEERSRYLLMKAADHAKDQTYFLSGLSQAQLGRLMLPLGDLSKARVRELAREQGWQDLADGPESQDFIEADNYGVLFKPGDAKPGPILDQAGREIGRHKGIIHYTIGQRKGLGLGGLDEPLFVTGVDACANTVTVGPREALSSREMVVRGVNWIACDGPPAPTFRASVKIRQQHREAPASVACNDGGQSFRVTFDEPQSAITAGQTAVLYDGDTVMAAGTIA